MADVAAALISTLKGRCAAVEDTFTLLWHNSSLQGRDLGKGYIAEHLIPMHNEDKVPDMIRIPVGI